MAIEVTCPGCKAKFRVSDQYAGQKGPCPKCKTAIEIPKKEDAEEEVVIHAPEIESTKGVTGTQVFRPIRRKETKVSVPLTVGIVGSVVIVLIVSFVLRTSIPEEGPIPEWAKGLLGFGAFALGPALAMAGYTFLRDSELEAYRGTELLVRSLICGTVYAILWAAYAFLKSYLFADVQLQTFHYFFLIPPFVLVGALASFASFDLDYGSGVIHYGLYLLVTLGLCLIIGVPLS